MSEPQLFKTGTNCAVLSAQLEKDSLWMDFEEYKFRIRSRFSSCFATCTTDQRGWLQIKQGQDGQEPEGTACIHSMRSCVTVAMHDAASNDFGAPH